jgi:hypothetical protein
VVWSLLLTAGSEGPTLISCTASHLLSSVRSWHTIVRISTDDDLTGCSMSAPVVYPQIDDVVEEDVGEDRADPRSLRRPDLHRFPSAALEDAGLEPPLDQAEDSRVSDPVPQHPNQPPVVNGVEGSLDRLPTTIPCQRK